MLQTVSKKHSLASRRLCDLHCMVVGNCFCHFVVRTSCNGSIASGAWLTVSYTQQGASSSVNVFGTSHVQQSLIASYQTRIAISDYTPHAFDVPVRGFPSEYRHPVWYGKKNCAATRGCKNFEDMFIRFDMIHERDRQTDTE